MTQTHIIPQQFKTGLEDQIFYWMDSQFDSQNHMVISFNDSIDEKILERATRLAIDAEPVLGCRYVPRTWRQIWERLDNLDEIELVKIIETKNDVEGIEKFLAQPNPIRPLEGPQVKIYILRAETDTICIKISHFAADGGGLKDFSYLLVNTYNHLLKNPEYVPPANTDGSRSLRQVTKNFKIKDIFNILKRSYKDMKGIFFPFAFRLPKAAKPDYQDRMFEVTKIKPEKFQRIKTYARKNDATINEIIVTAYFRTFYKKINPSPKATLRLVTTVDLRRFIPSGKAESVCGLSGFIYMNIGKKRGESFEETLSLVKKYMAEIKNDYPGLGGSVPFTALFFKALPVKLALYLHDIMGEHMKKQVMYPGNTVPILTNAGKIDENKYNFGTAEATNMIITAPLSYTPTFATTITTFKDEMSLCIGYCEKTIKKSEVKAFFEFMVNDLPG